METNIVAYSLVLDAMFCTNLDRDRQFVVQVGKKYRKIWW